MQSSSITNYPTKPIIDSTVFKRNASQHITDGCCEMINRYCSVYGKENEKWYSVPN